MTVHPNILDHLLQKAEEGPTVTISAQILADLCKDLGRTRHLLRELFRVHEAMESSEFGPPGYDEVIAEVRKELGHA